VLRVWGVVGEAASIVAGCRNRSPASWREIANGLWRCQITIVCRPQRESHAAEQRRLPSRGWGRATRGRPRYCLRSLGAHRVDRRLRASLHSAQAGHLTGLLPSAVPGATQAFRRWRWTTRVLCCMLAVTESPSSASTRYAGSFSAHRCRCTTGLRPSPQRARLV
jgi:hypothetical protein